jgi:hypothetical protein
METAQNTALPQTLAAQLKAAKGASGMQGQLRRARLRSLRVTDCVSDAQLVSRVAQHDETALRELSHRHADALSVLACAIVRQPGWARRAVADVFSVVWDEPEQLGATNISVRAQLAALVHEHCRTMELHASGHDDSLAAKEGTRRRDATPARIAVALIAFGDHTCPQAAERVGTDVTVVAERLRAFVLDPDHFQDFCTNDKVVPLDDARRRRYPQ